MEPEKNLLEKEIPFGNHSFSASMLNFGGVTYFISGEGNNIWKSDLEGAFAVSFRVTIKPPSQIGITMSSQVFKVLNRCWSWTQMKQA